MRKLLLLALLSAIAVGCQSTGKNWFAKSNSSEVQQAGYECKTG